MFINFLIIVSVVIFACVIFNSVSTKFGVPMLLVFILLGMFFGSDGVVKIPFDNYIFAEQVCTVALLFIMFYGGFGTRWSKAKPVAIMAITLSSIGTLITALLTGVFCYYFLKIDFLESFLIGAVISSTDAASVFSILRSNRLNLRYNTASLLEIESGSNDPFSYMLTLIILSLMNGNLSPDVFISTLLHQIIFGIAFGVIIALVAYYFLKKFNFTTEGFDTIFIVGVAIITYSATSYVGGNGFLSTYITGLILGNLKLKNKQTLVHFFDAVTGLMQMLLFFVLGLLSFPSELPKVALSSLCIFLALTFIIRPIAVFATLAPFKCKLNQQALVSWAGMRGAASIVFAIMTVTSPAVTHNDIFHTIFFVVLLSIMLQGTLLPKFAKKLDMVDNESDVMKTFTDYIEDTSVKSIQFNLSSDHTWVGKAVRNIIFPPQSVLVLVVRNGNKITPNGDLVLCENDTLILIGITADNKNDIDLYEKTILKGDDWSNKLIKDIPKSEKLIIMIRRGENIIIPNGSTLLLENDVVVINNSIKTMI